MTMMLTVLYGFLTPEDMMKHDYDMPWNCIHTLSFCFIKHLHYIG